MKTVGFSGGDGGKMKGMNNVDIIIPAEHVCRIQEGHCAVGHIICDVVENIMYE